MTLYKRYGLKNRLELDNASPFLNDLDNVGDFEINKLEFRFLGEFRLIGKLDIDWHRIKSLTVVEQKYNLQYLIIFLICVMLIPQILLQTVEWAIGMNDPYFRWWIDIPLRLILAVGFGLLVYALIRRKWLELSYDSDDHEEIIYLINKNGFSFDYTKIISEFTIARFIREFCGYPGIDPIFHNEIELMS